MGVSNLSVSQSTALKEGSEYYHPNQQQFGHPVYSSNGQEPSNRTYEPTGRDTTGADRGAYNWKIDIVHHEEENEEFLDFYDEKSYGEIMLRRRKPIPEEHIHREIPQRTPHLAGLMTPMFETQGRQQPRLQQERQELAEEQTGHITRGESSEAPVHKAQRERLVQQSQYTESGQRSGIVPESAYKNSPRAVQFPRYTPRLEPRIRGGSGFPPLYPRVLTISETEDLQRRLRLQENELLQREEYCRVCDKTFRHGSSEVAQHYPQHKLKHLCPMCQQDWTELTRQDQISHLISNHLNRRSQIRGGCPAASCSEDLANVASFPDLSHVLEHLQSHVEHHPVVRAMKQKPKICSYPGCYADINLFTSQQRNQHRGTHLPSEPSGKTKDIETQTERVLPGPPPISPEKPPPSTKAYCDRCLECMQSLPEKKRQDHAKAECKTTVEAFLQLTQAEAREQKAIMTASKAAQARKATPTAIRTLRNREYSTPVEEEDSDEEPMPVSTVAQRKRKPTAKATPTPNKRSRKK